MPIKNWSVCARASGLRGRRRVVARALVVAVDASELYARSDSCRVADGKPAPDAPPLHIYTQRRLRGAAFDSLLDEVVHALRAVAPRAVLQFEDFGSATAFDRYLDGGSGI